MTIFYARCRYSDEGKGILRPEEGMIRLSGPEEWYLVDKGTLVRLSSGEYAVFVSARVDLKDGKIPVSLVNSNRKVHKFRMPVDDIVSWAEMIGATKLN